MLVTFFHSRTTFHQSLITTEMSRSTQLVYSVGGLCCPQHVSNPRCASAWCIVAYIDVRTRALKVSEIVRRCSFPCALKSKALRRFISVLDYSRDTITRCNIS
jgi:hypothetical protein